MECLRTPPRGILTNPGVVILLLINGHSRLLPRVLTLALVSTMIVPLLSLGSPLQARSFSLSPSFFVSPSHSLFFSLLSLRILDFLSSYAFCETPPSSDLSVIRPSTQIKASSADLPPCVPLTPFPLSYTSPLPSSEKDVEGFESVRDPSSLREGGSIVQPEKDARTDTRRDS